MMLLTEPTMATASNKWLVRYFSLGRLLQSLSPLVDFLLRLALFRVFFWAGLTKVNDWSGALALFENEYNVPLLHPTLAGVVAASSELGASLLILAGFLTRLAALPLLAMTLVIQFVLGANDPAYNQLQHYLWMVLLLTLITRGPGAWSLDAWLERQVART